MKDDKPDTVEAQYRRALAAVGLRVSEAADQIRETAEALRRTAPTTEQESHLDTLLTGAGRLATVAEHLHDYAAARFGDAEPAKRDFDLIEVVEELSDPLAIAAQSRGLVFVANVEPTVPTLLRGDPVQLRRLLTLLLENAVAFTARGEVCLRIEADPPAGDTANLTFTVLDTGCGVETEQCRHLLQPFWQADPGAGRGCGLGLATAAAIVQKLGSRLDFHSQPDCGSSVRFQLQIPVQCDRVEGPPPVDLTGTRILIADANASQRLALQSLLRAWGGRCDLAATTAEVRHLARLAVGKPLWNLLLVDPDSLELSPGDWSREFAGDAALAGTPSLFLQPLAALPDAARDLESASGAHLYKPVRRAHLCRAVARALRIPDDAGKCADDAERAADPATTAEPVAAPEPVAAADLDGDTAPLILLAEDNRVNRKVAVTMLTAAGYRVETVTNGQEAIEALAGRRYDLILMDVGMPIMDGLQATRNIRDGWHGAGNEKIPIIAMTAHAMKGDRERCLAAGMDDYVAKPVQPEELQAVVERCLAAAAPRPAVADSATHATDDPLLDKTALLARFAGDEDQARQSLICLLEEAPRLLRDIRAALRDGDGDRLKAHAAQLEEAASLCAATALRTIAVGVRDGAERGELTGLGALVTEAEITFVRLKHLLARGPVTV